MSGLFGHCPNGGGVSTLAQMVWGTYFEKNCPFSKGHLLGLGGSEPLPGWFGALAVKIEAQMAFAQVGTEIKCPRVPV